MNGYTHTPPQLHAFCHTPLEVRAHKPVHTFSPTHICSDTFSPSYTHTNTLWDTLLCTHTQLHLHIKQAEVQSWESIDAIRKRRCLKIKKKWRDLFESGEGNKQGRKEEFLKRKKRRHGERDSGPWNKNRQKKERTEPLEREFRKKGKEVFFSSFCFFFEIYLVGGEG